LPWELNRAAQESGVRVILDGFDGDTTVSHGAVRFTELAEAGQWEVFAREAGAVSQHFPVSAQDLLQTYGLNCLDSLAKKQRWLTFCTAINQINKYFHVSRRDLVWRHGLTAFVPARILRRQRSRNNGVDPIINPDFARYVGLQERMRVLDRDRSNPPRTVREDQWRSLTSGLFTSVLELSDRSAAAFSVDVRHPFMDKRLIEFCLALPPEQKLYQGWSRIVMRRAMSNILPEEVRWRGGKTDLNANFLRGLMTFDRKILDDMVFGPSEAFAKYIDTAILRLVYQRLRSRDKVKLDDVMRIWKAVTLAYWLENIRTSNADYQKVETSEGVNVKTSYKQIVKSA